MSEIEFIPMSLLTIIKYHREEPKPCDHRFTANKDFFFISNEFGGRTNVKQNKRIINGKST